MARVERCDIIVIGGGSAAFEAAVAAREAGAERVVMLEKAPEAEYGGNARYSGTGFRFVHAGSGEIRQFVPDVDDALFDSMVIPPYSADDFLAALFCANNRGDDAAASLRGRTSRRSAAPARERAALDSSTAVERVIFIKAPV